MRSHHGPVDVFGDMGEESLAVALFKPEKNSARGFGGDWHGYSYAAG
jgi:hypothetical protein